MDLASTTPAPGRYFTDQELLHRPETVAAILRNGGVAVIPTDTLYGFAARVRDEAALEKLFRLKGRSLERQVPVLVENPEVMVEGLVSEISDLARILMREFWPGPLTLVLPAKPGLSRYITGNTQSVGIRQSAHPSVRALIQALGEPITGTSANLSDGPSPFSLDQIPAALLQAASVVVDGGKLPGRKGSTVLDLTGSEVKILRQGDLPLERIRSVIDL